jgi:hypothetical protein
MNAPENKSAFAQVAIEVNKKVSGKYSKVGEISIYVPTLADAGIVAEVQLDSKTNEPIIEDGLPVYKEDKFNWVQGAILAQVKAQARNKLVSGTADLKAGQAIAADWPTLTAEGERGGNGEALAIVREAKASFAKWVASLGRSAAAQQTLNMLFSNKQALSLQSTDNKAKVAKYVEDFAISLEAAELERYTKYLESVQVACESTVEAEDF